jgi:hypothetical protein
MGYAVCYGPCIICEKVFGFNPHKVPSYRTVTDGPRYPICQHCINKINPERKRRGLPQWPVHPDAYEPIEETEL